MLTNTEPSKQFRCCIKPADNIKYSSVDWGLNYCSIVNMFLFR